jgi:hypothetical protein
MDLSKLQLPSQKEFGAGAGGILAFLIILALHVTNHDMGDAFDAALVTLLPAIVAKIVPPSKQDVLNHINDEIAQAGVIVGKLTAASDQNAPPTPAAVDLAARARAGV